MAPLIRRALASLALTWVAAVTTSSAVETSGIEASEAAIKAAYLFHIGTFAEWPTDLFPSPSSPIRFGVVESDEIGRALGTAVAGRSIGGRPIEVVTLQRGDATDRIHILFVGRELDQSLGELLAARAARGVLLVTESEGALELGSAINFVNADKRIRFDISLRAAESAGVKLSSRLLGVARQVREGGSK